MKYRFSAKGKNTLDTLEAKGKEFNTDDMEAVTQFPVEDKEQIFYLVIRQMQEIIEFWDKSPANGKI